MKPLNNKERKKNLLQFTLIFGIMTLTLFISGFMTIKTAKKGIDVLEKKHARYSEIFRKKAALFFEVEEIIKKLHQLKNKDRNLSQHKKFQTLISNIRDKISESINKEEKSEEFIVYLEMVDEIKAIQNDLDIYEEGNEKYEYLDELLEKCKEKYIENQENKK